MSHYTKMSIAAQQKYEAELISALKNHFGEKAVESCGDKKQKLKDWQGQDTSMKANIIIRKKDLGKKIGRSVLANDLGYERNKDGGYDVHVDAAGFPQSDQDLVAKFYADKVATKQLKAQGYQVKRAELATGEVELVGTRYAG